VVSRAPLTIVVLLAASIWALTLIGHGWMVPIAFFTPASIVVSALSLVLLLWDRWLWRLGPLHPWLVHRPDLRGTWKGELTRTDEKPLVIFLVVEQAFWTIHLRTFTAESRSASVIASLSEADGQFLLASLYRNEPRLNVQDRSRPHQGATMLWVHGSPPHALSGAYWTDRDTKGELHYDRVCRQLASDFGSAEGLAAQASPSSLRSAPRDMPNRRAASD
jgi:hypothetical protein